MNKLFNLKIWWSEIDKINFILISALLIIGILLSFSLSDSFVIFNKHLIFAIIAFFVMFFLSNFEPKTLRRISLFCFLFLLLMLILILFFDYEIKGSKRWLKFYGFSLQPSEFIKPFYFILSSWLIIQGINGRKSYLFVLILSFIVISGLVILQPDFGMTFLIFLTFFCQLFIAGLSYQFKDSYWLPYLVLVIGLYTGYRISKNLNGNEWWSRKFHLIIVILLCIVSVLIILKKVNGKYISYLL